MKKVMVQSTAIIIFVLVLNLHFQSQTKVEVLPNNKIVAKWFKSRTWLGGFKAKPHSSINQKEFYVQYTNNKVKWDQAFAYLKETDLANLKPGKYPIDGENVFATVAETKSKEFEVSKWESHRKYSDIHFVIRGKEKIGIAPISSLTVRTLYDETIDAAFYDGEGKYYIAEPGIFFICFPNDAHRPNIKVDGYDTDLKVVIKIRTDR